MPCTTFKTPLFYMDIKPLFTSPSLDLPCEVSNHDQHADAAPTAYDSDEESTSSSSLDGESTDSQTSDSSDPCPSLDEEQYADAAEDWAIPLITVTPPTDREPPFFLSSIEPSLLDAQPWSFPTIHSQLTNGTGAMNLLYASMGDPILRRNITQAYALARKIKAKESKALPIVAQELQIDAKLVIGGVDSDTRSTEPCIDGERARSLADEDAPTDLFGVNASRDRALEHVSDEAFGPYVSASPGLAILDTKVAPEEAQVTLQDLLTDQDDSDTWYTRDTPLIVVTEPDADDVAPPPVVPEAPQDPSLLDATKWDLLRFRIILADPQRAGKLERQAKKDSRVARQVAQAFAVARRQGIQFPSFEEFARLRREAEEHKRAMAEEWQRTLAGFDERQGGAWTLYTSRGHGSTRG